MKDGLYRVEYKGITAGFVVEDGRVTQCAPVLRRKLSYFKTIATRINTEQNMAKLIRPQDMWDKEEIDRRVDAEKAATLSRKKEDWPDARTCFKCGGTGYLPQFVHIADGMCFPCWGLGFISRERVMRYHQTWETE